MEYSRTFPILLSLQVGATSLAIVAPLGIALAWVQARRRYTLRRLVDALILLPLVMPPTVIGYFLVLVFGRHGAVGHWLESLGLRIIFTPAAAVVASSVVALPLVVKTVQPAIEAVEPDLEDVARTLGLGGIPLFFRVTLPLAWRGVLAGLVLGFARAVAEFGATLMFAGNVPGVTNTMPLEIFAAYQGGEDARALLYVAVLTLFSCVVVVAASRLSPRGMRV